MTNKELHEEINCLKTKLAELEEKVSALPNEDDSGGVFKPKFEQTYWFISGVREIDLEKWCNLPMQNVHYSIGNCFPSRQSAEDAIRVLKLTQKARESQDGFVPDWGDSTQPKYLLSFNSGDIYFTRNWASNAASIFGYWEGKSMCRQFIHENEEELIWFFTEYRR